METTEQSGPAQALEALDGRIADFKQFNKLSPSWEDQPTEEDQKILDELGNPHEYGLSLEKESYSYRDELYTWSYVLSTGGPHDEFTFAADKNGTLDGEITFVFMPWFGRYEKSVDDLSQEDGDAVKNFIVNYLYLEVYDD